MWRGSGNSLSDIEMLKCCDYVLPSPPSLPPPLAPGMAPKAPPPVEPASIAVVDCYSTGIPSWLTEMNKPLPPDPRGCWEVFPNDRCFNIESLQAEGWTCKVTPAIHTQPLFCFFLTQLV